MGVWQSGRSEVVIYQSTLFIHGHAKVTGKEVHQYLN